MLGKTTCTFPQDGDEAQTRAWLDQEGFQGIFDGWKANAILGQSKEYILNKVPGERGYILWGLLETARLDRQSND